MRGTRRMTRVRVVGTTALRPLGPTAAFHATGEPRQTKAAADARKEPAGNEGKRGGGVGPLRRQTCGSARLVVRPAIGDLRDYAGAGFGEIPIARLDVLAEEHVPHPLRSAC